MRFMKINYTIRNKYHALLAITIIIIYSIFTSGCSTLPNKPMPSPKGQFVVKILSEGISELNDLPMGSYRIPDSNVIVLSEKGNSAKSCGMAFGLLGAFVANSIGKEHARKDISGVENTLKIGLDIYTKNILEKKFKETSPPSNWTLDEKGTNGRLEITPYVIMTLDMNSTGKLYLFLKTKILKKNKEIWEGKYVYYVPVTRTLKGENSWTDNDAKEMKTEIFIGIDKTIDVMINDTKEPSIWKKDPVKISGTFLGKSYTLNGLLLKKSDKTIILNNGLKNIFYGINIIPRHDITLIK